MSEEIHAKRKRMHYRLIALLLIALSSSFLGIIMNIYLHEVGHYLVADHFGLNPTMHFTTGSNREGSVFSLILSKEFKAYVKFDALGGDMQNLLVTAAGPLVNLGISMVLASVYFLVVKRLKKNQRLYKKHFWNFLLVDAIFVSLLIPSVLSFLINMSWIAGSDGAIIYELLGKLFF